MSLHVHYTCADKRKERRKGGEEERREGGGCLEYEYITHVCMCVLGISIMNKYEHHVGISTYVVSCIQL